MSTAKSRAGSDAIRGDNRLSERPLRFLHVTSFYPPYSFGGDAIYVQRIARALVSMGHQVDVVHCVDSYLMFGSGEPVQSSSKEPNLTIHGLRSGYGALSPLLSHQTGRPLLKMRQLREIIANRRPDVIHYHNISLLGPGVLEIDGGNPEVIKLYTAHEHWLVCPNHVLWKFNRKACDGPQCIRCVLMARRPPQLWRYTGMLERCAAEVDAFLAFTRFTAEIHAARGFSHPFVHFPPFTECAPDRDRDRPSRKRPYFLFVGRLEPVKGVRFLVESWSDDLGSDLLIAGSGTEEVSLRKLASSKTTIKFLGHQPQEALNTLYHDCVACIVPSVTYEVFPTVILEAFARRAPVLARDLGPLREILEESSGGIIFRDKTELVSAIRRMLESDTLRKELGGNGFRAFIARWTPTRHFERYFDLLRTSALRKLGHVPWEERG